MSGRTLSKKNTFSVMSIFIVEYSQHLKDADAASGDIIDVFDSKIELEDPRW